jgi:hypothetical protein
MLGDSGGRVLPIVLRILLGSTSDINLSLLINLFASIGKQRTLRPLLCRSRHLLLALLQLGHCVCARAELSTSPISNPTRLTLLA